MKTISLAVAAIFFFSLDVISPQHINGQKNGDVKSSHKMETAGKTGKTGKKAVAKTSKKDKYIFKKEEDSTYKLDEAASPINSKKTVSKKKTRIKMERDYKNFLNNAPFKSYKFDEKGNPISDPPESGSKSKRTKREQKDSELDLPVENEKIKTR